MKFPGFAVGLVLLPFALGCGEARPEAAAPSTGPLPSAPGSFVAETAGTIRGRVAWEGAIPRPAPYRVSPPAMPGNLPGGQTHRDNPNAPIVDPRTRAVGNAVVFLRGIDPRSGRPWDHPPVRVELADFTIQVGHQPGRPGYGFVRRGDALRIVSRQPTFQALHADGASFFSLAFPDPNEPLTRRLLERGVVELTSAAGHFWMRAYLFVDDHPYYARTQSDGSFALSQVPPGDYELVCWMPSWIEQRRNRDPESGLVSRIFYRPAVEIVRQVRVGPRETCEVLFTLSAAAFERKN